MRRCPSRVAARDGHHSLCGVDLAHVSAFLVSASSSLVLQHERVGRGKKVLHVRVPDEPLPYCSGEGCIANSGYISICRTRCDQEKRLRDGLLLTRNFC